MIRFIIAFTVVCFASSCKKCMTCVRQDALTGYTIDQLEVCGSKSYLEEESAYWTSIQRFKEANWCSVPVKKKD